MLEDLKKHNSIVVSGPQRSGTRICAKIIAHDTDKTYIDEKEINYHDFRLLNWYLNQGNVVVQCPGLCHMLHYIKNKSTLVVVVRRPIDEITLSEHRCWSLESKRIELFKYGHSGGIISQIKYKFWDEVQKSILSDLARDIHYHKLENHKLFIKDRKDFRWDQTTINKR